MRVVCVRVWGCVHAVWVLCVCVWGVRVCRGVYAVHVCRAADIVGVVCMCVGGCVFVGVCVRRACV